MADATPELGPSDALVASAHQTAGPYWHLVDFPEWADTTRHFAGNLFSFHWRHDRYDALPRLN